MTKEEANKALEQQLDVKAIYEIGFDDGVKAYKNLIELEKEEKEEDAEDCISRQEALSHKHIVYDDDGIGYSVVKVDEIMALPSVTPKQKTGRWLMPQQDDGMSDPIYYQVRCSECGFDLDPQTWHMELHQYGADKYCPNCGSRMAESEDKE